MSNRTLGLAILILILVFAGSVVYFKQSSSRQQNLEGSSDGYTQGSSEELLNNLENMEQRASAPNGSVIAGAETESGQCVRNFDENKLKNDTVSLAGRQVEMRVKDFGSIKLEFYEKDAPKTVENFLRLTNAGFYDCLTIHRVAKGFVIQGGDPNGNGTGGISAFGDKFEDELNPESPSYKAGYVKGVLAMANSGPNTNTSQFFIMLDNVPLPNNYTIFGKVLDGQEVVDKIGQVDIIPQLGPNDGAPKTPVILESVKIIK